MRPWHAAVPLALLHLVLALLSLDPTPHAGGDSAAYLALAQSILEHGTYQELWDPAVRSHTQYPPGWPLILAGAMTRGDQALGRLQGASSILFSAAAVALSYLWARRVSTPGVALAVGVLLARELRRGGPGALGAFRRAVLGFTMLALWAFARVARSTGPGGGAGRGRTHARGGWRRRWRSPPLRCCWRTSRAPPALPLVVAAGGVAGVAAALAGAGAVRGVDGPVRAGLVGARAHGGRRVVRRAPVARGPVPSPRWAR